MIDFDRHLNRAAVRVFGSAAPVAYTRAAVGSVAFAVPAVVDRRYVEIGFGEDGSPVSAIRSTLFVRLADMAGGVPPDQGDGVAIGGVAWTVQEVRPDAIGGFLLILGART